MSLSENVVLACFAAGAVVAVAGHRFLRKKKGIGRHEADVNRKRDVLKALPRPREAPTVLCRVAPARAAMTEVANLGPKDKVVHFIRHGQGFHNVAQKEWYAAGKPGVPYTIDTDPDGSRYGDAQLTPVGIGQATDLQAQTKGLVPELLVLSPMRRAMKTGLLAFDKQVKAGDLPVICVELAHEIAGKHTCDKRLNRSELMEAFPEVNWELSAVPTEEDPYWGDGRTREQITSVASRADQFLAWLRARPEKHVAVATHSCFLLALFNGVLRVPESMAAGDAEELTTWFATGEMRTVVLHWE